MERVQEDCSRQTGPGRGARLPGVGAFFSERRKSCRLRTLAILHCRGSGRFPGGAPCKVAHGMCRNEQAESGIPVVCRVIGDGCREPGLATSEAGFLFSVPRDEQRVHQHRLKDSETASLLHPGLNNPRPGRSKKIVAAAKNLQEQRPTRGDPTSTFRSIGKILIILSRFLETPGARAISNCRSLLLSADGRPELRFSCVTFPVSRRTSW